MGHFLSCNRNLINAWRTVEHDVHPLNRTSFFPSYENHVCGIVCIFKGLSSGGVFGIFTC